MCWRGSAARLAVRLCRRLALTGTVSRPAGNVQVVDTVAEAIIGPETKGLRLARAVPLAKMRERLQHHPEPVTGPLFSWPLVTAADSAISHNLATMADACREYDTWLAPHIKTHMSPQLWARQQAAGAWAATVAMPHQLRAAYAWGARRFLLANELVDPRELAWLAELMADDGELEVWLEVDSFPGVALLAAAFADQPPAVRNRMHPLVEVGVPAGRAGVRVAAEAVAVAKALLAAKFQVAGVIGFEGPVAGDAGDESLRRVRAWVDEAVQIAAQVAEVAGAESGRTAVGSESATAAKHPAGARKVHSDLGAHPFVLSLGGSAYIDIVLPALRAVRKRGWQGVIRSGSYVTHDSGHYKHLDPWARLPGSRDLIPALTVWAQVLSIPEPGWAILNAGKRDLATDLDAPDPIWWQRESEPRHEFTGRRGIMETNDQHSFLSFDDIANPLAIGDIIGLSPSHPCTQLDKWRILSIINDDAAVVDLYKLEF